YGEETLTPAFPLRIDGQIPTVRITRTGSSITVRVTDPRSGVDAHAVSVSFGDGAHASGRATYRHRYAHAGSYRVTVGVRNNVGEAGVVTQTVVVS
ncbi:MAG TPA: PKD domain-containing protein, partial [Solirubrobacteraceae bacterium]|nr:PKD domain-containing protein [Solirubrobacteraceae bacterium]